MTTTDDKQASDVKGCAQFFGVVFGVVAVLILIGLGWNAVFGTSDERTFDDAIDEGMSCDELQRLVSSQDPSWAGRDRANEQMFQLGCNSPGAQRQTSTTMPLKTPSAKCSETMRRLDQLAESATDEVFDSLAAQSLSDCRDAPSWLAAAKSSPGALSLVSGAYVTTDSLELWCLGRTAAPVCVDAVERGWFPAP